MEQLAQDIAAAINTGKPNPKMPVGLKLEQAYEIQKAVVSQVAPQAVSGLKAGVTTEAVQQQFGVEQPLLASLFSRGENQSGCTLKTRPGVLIECEIGIEINAAGDPVAAMPVIEIPYMEFTDPSDRNGVNLTATNVASDRYIIGEKQAFRASYADNRVRLSCNGEKISDAPLSEAQGGPHLGLAWMLEEAKQRGIETAAGMLLITGACGGIHPGKPGKYRADYGDLGSVEFELI